MTLRQLTANLTGRNARTADLLAELADAKREGTRLNKQAEALRKAGKTSTPEYEKVRDAVRARREEIARLVVMVRDSRTKASRWRRDIEKAKSAAASWPKLTAFIAREEGYRPHVYLDSVGVRTRYYGETDPKIVNGPQLSEPRARKHLEGRIRGFARQVDALIRVTLTFIQLAVLTSWAYNCGLGAVRDSTLRRKLNDGNYSAVPGELMEWVKGGGRTIAGLVNRRKREVSLWKYGRWS